MGKLIYTSEFESAWVLYPSRGDAPNPKLVAFKAWKARLREGITPDELLPCVLEYSRACRRMGKTGTEFVMQAATFFGPNRRWEDYKHKPLPLPETKPISVREPEERIDARPFIKEILEKLAGAVKSPTANFVRAK